MDAATASKRKLILDSLLIGVYVVFSAFYGYFLIKVDNLHVTEEKDNIWALLLAIYLLLSIAYSVTL